MLVSEWNTQEARPRKFYRISPDGERLAAALSPTGTGSTPRSAASAREADRMSTLTDRYVWGVLRAVPEAQRADLEPEIRALVADAVEARAEAADATARPRSARRCMELGDPEHAGGPLHRPDDGPHRPAVLPRVAAPAACSCCRSSSRSSRIVVGAARRLAGETARAGRPRRDRRSRPRHGRRPAGVLDHARVRVPRAARADERDRRGVDAGRAAGAAGRERRRSVVEVALSHGRRWSFGGRAHLWQQVAQPITIDGESLPGVRSRPVVVLAALVPRRPRRSRSCSRSSAGGGAAGPGRSRSSTSGSTSRSPSRRSGSSRTTCCSTRAWSPRSIERPAARGSSRRCAIGALVVVLVARPRTRSTASARP